MKRALFIVLVLSMMVITVVPSWARIEAPTAPTAIMVNIASPANNAVVTTSSATVSGTSTPGSTLLLTIDGGTSVSVTADAAGNWSYIATGLAQGSHTAQMSGQKETDPYIYMADQSCGVAGAGGTGTSCVRLADTADGQILATFQTTGNDSRGSEAVIVSPDQSKLYVLHASGVDVFQISDNAFLQRIPLPLPTQLAALAPNGRLWVTLQSSERGQMAIINTTTDTLEATIDTFQLDGAGNVRIASNPHDVVFSPDGARAYIADRGDYGLLVIDTTTRTIIGRFDGTNGNTASTVTRRLVRSADGSTIWTSSRAAGRVMRFATATNTLSAIPFNSGTQLEGIALTTDESRLWVARYAEAGGAPGQSVAVINPSTNAIVGAETIILPSADDEKPRPIERNPYNGLMYIGTNTGIYVYNDARVEQAGRYIAAGINGSVYDLDWLRRYDRASDRVTFSVDLTSDLSLAKRHLGQNFVVGQQGQYVFTVTNAGPAAADAPITISDTLPAGLTPIAVQTPNWTSSINGQVVTLTRSAPIPANVTTTPITVTVNVGAQAVGRITNTACVSAPNDDQPANNCGSDIVTIVPVADVSIRKTSDTRFVVGQTGTYTLTIQNNGPSISSAPITVTDTLPNGLMYVSAVGAGWQCSNTGQTFRCISSVSLAANTTATPIIVRVNVLAAAAPSVTNTAVVSTTTTDTVPNNNTSTITTPVIAIANVNIRKTSDSRFIVGQTGTYTLTIQNNGPSISSAPITVTDSLPSGLNYLNATGTGWQCSNTGQIIRCISSVSLAANATATPIVVRVNVLASAAPSVTNTAIVSTTTTDTVPTDNISTVTTPVLISSVAIGKVANPPSGTWVAANQLITYTLRITNTGTLTLTNLLLSDSVPQYTTYITNSAQPTPLAQTSPLRWRFVTLAPGATRTTSFVVRVQARGDITEIRNSATVDSDETAMITSNETIHPFDPTAINLTSFTVSHFPQRHAAWTTASEHGTAGFNLYSTIQPSFTGTIHRINALVIPATGSPTQGASYEYSLLLAEDAVPLYFWLEEVEQNGATTVYGPALLSSRYVTFIPLISR